MTKTNGAAPRAAVVRGYCEAVAEEVLARVRAGEPLKAIQRSPGTPTATTLLRWARQRPEFARRLAAARDAAQAEALLERRAPVRFGQVGRPSTYTPAIGRGVRGDRRQCAAAPDLRGAGDVGADHDL